MDSARETARQPRDDPRDMERACREALRRLPAAQGVVHMAIRRSRLIGKRSLRCTVNVWFRDSVGVG